MYVVLAFFFFLSKIKLVRESSVVSKGEKGNSAMK